MQDSLVRRLYISTRATDTDSVEMIVADTGLCVSRDDREKLFLPYFSTKRRGTGLGLAIVSRILADHSASIRVESNSPGGARFIVEVRLWQRRYRKLAWRRLRREDFAHLDCR